MSSRRFMGADLPLSAGVALICALPIALPAAAADSAGADDQAATQSPAEPGGPPANSSEQVQEIVVTAQFRSQNLQSTPLAITAVTAQMLEARGQHNVEDVANRAPSVTLTTAGGGQGGSQTTAINIRGIGQSDFNLALEPGVGMYIDDVYFGTMYGSMFDLIDLDRVEILRGPQGTLSGKNSEGGALKLYSKQPGPDGGGYVEADFGNYNRRQVRGGMNFTMVPDLLYARITGLATRQDGYVTRYDYRCSTGNPADQLGSIPSMALGGPESCKLGTEGGKDVIALRAAVRFVPNELVQDTMTYDTTRDRSEPPATVLTYQGTWHGPGYSLLGAPGPNPAGNFAVPYGSYYNYASYCGLVGTPGQYCLEPVDKLDSWGLSNDLEWQPMDGLNIKSISAYRNLNQTSVADTDGSPFARNMSLWTIQYAQFTQELRVSGHVGSLLDWTAGGYYFSANARQGGRISIDGAGDNLIPFFTTTDFMLDDPVRIRSKSGFLHLELHPVDKLTVTGGLRYTSDYKSYGFARYFAPGYTPGPIDQAIASTNGLHGLYEGNRWDYRVTAGYQIQPSLNAYAQFATGFKGGGINPRPYYAEQVRSFDPETVDAYEVGLKSDWLDRRLRINLAAFYNKYKNMQLTLTSCPQFVPEGQVQNCQMPANVGNSTIKGVEIESEAHLIEGLALDASLSYVDFNYDSVDPATGIRLSDKPPFTPKVKAAVGAQYEFLLGTAGTITPRVDYQYQSTVYSEAINYPFGRIAGYSLVNARLAYQTADKDWEAAFSVSNLLNRYYYLTKYDSAPPANNPPSYDFVTAQPGAPRMFRVTIRRNF